MEKNCLNFLIFFLQNMLAVKNKKDKKRINYKKSIELNW